MQDALRKYWCRSARPGRLPSLGSFQRQLRRLPSPPTSSRTTYRLSTGTRYQDLVCDKQGSAHSSTSLPRPQIVTRKWAIALSKSRTAGIALDDTAYVPLRSGLTLVLQGMTRRGDLLASELSEGLLTSARTCGPQTMWLLKLHLISLNVKQPIPFLTEQILRFRLKRDRITFPVLETTSGMQPASR